MIKNHNHLLSRAIVLFGSIYTGLNVLCFGDMFLKMHNRGKRIKPSFILLVTSLVHAMHARFEGNSSSKKHSKMQSVVYPNTIIL